jgi:hypothetical protein
MSEENYSLFCQFYDSTVAVENLAGLVLDAHEGIRRAVENIDLQSLDYNVSLLAARVRLLSTIIAALPSCATHPDFAGRVDIKDMLDQAKATANRAFSIVERAIA